MAPIPYPGCAAALKCVLEEFCSLEGVMVFEPVDLTPVQKQYRVPLMSCLNVETNRVGYCCRDPLYNDPWPAGMPMPGMPAVPPPVQPVVVPSPSQPSPSIVRCRQDQQCLAEQLCASPALQQGTQQFNVTTSIQFNSIATQMTRIIIRRTPRIATILRFKYN